MIRYRHFSIGQVGEIRRWTHSTDVRVSRTQSPIRCNFAKMWGGCSERGKPLPMALKTAKILESIQRRLYQSRTDFYESSNIQVYYIV